MQRGATSSIRAGSALVHHARRGATQETSAAPRHHRHTREDAVISSHGPRRLAARRRGTPARGGVTRSRQRRAVNRIDHRSARAGSVGLWSRMVGVLTPLQTRLAAFRDAVCRRKNGEGESEGEPSPDGLFCVNDPDTLIRPHVVRAAPRRPDLPPGLSECAAAPDAGTTRSGMAATPPLSAVPEGGLAPACVRSGGRTDEDGES